MTTDRRQGNKWPEGNLQQYRSREARPPFAFGDLRQVTILLSGPLSVCVSSMCRDMRAGEEIEACGEVAVTAVTATGLQPNYRENRDNIPTFQKSAGWLVKLSST